MDKLDSIVETQLLSLDDTDDLASGKYLYVYTCMLYVYTRIQSKLNIYINFPSMVRCVKEME